MVGFGWVVNLKSYTNSKYIYIYRDFLKGPLIRPHSKLDYSFVMILLSLNESRIDFVIANNMFVYQTSLCATQFTFVDGSKVFVVWLSN